MAGRACEWCMARPIDEVRGGPSNKYRHQDGGQTRNSAIMGRNSRLDFGPKRNFPIAQFGPGKHICDALGCLDGIVMEQLKRLPVRRRRICALDSRAVLSKAEGEQRKKGKGPQKSCARLRSRHTLLRCFAVLYAMLGDLHRAKRARKRTKGRDSASIGYRRLPSCRETEGMMADPPRQSKPACASLTKLTPSARYGSVSDDSLQIG